MCGSLLQKNHLGRTFMRRSYRLRTLCLAVTAVLVAACGSGSGGDPMNPSAKGAVSNSAGKPPPNAVAAPPGITTDKVDQRLARASGPVDVWVTLDTPSLAAQQAIAASAAGVEKAKQLASSDKTAFDQTLQKQRSDLLSQQSKVAAGLASTGAEE